MESKNGRENTSFYCYSAVMMHFLKACGLDYESKGKNQVSGKPYWVFEKGDTLTKALAEWSLFKWARWAPIEKLRYIMQNIDRLDHSVNKLMEEQVYVGDSNAGED
jgi:hypothetical protein